MNNTRIGGHPSISNNQILTNYVLALRRRAASLSGGINVKIMVFRGPHTPGFDVSDNFIAKPISTNLTVPQEFKNLKSVKVPNAFVARQIDLVKILIKFATHQQRLVPLSATLDPANYTDLEMDLEETNDNKCVLRIKISALDVKLGPTVFLRAYNTALASLILTVPAPA